MKINLFVICIAVICWRVCAQSVPSLINFQGRLAGVTGQGFAPGKYLLQFRIWNSMTSGSGEIWSQQKTVSVQSNGVFNTILGAEGEIPIPGEVNVPFTDLSQAFGDQNRFLGITIAMSNGVPISTPVEIIPRQQLLSTPFTIHASTADSAINGTPIGSIMAFGGSTPPSGWLLCDGAAIDRNIYSNLFAVLGVNYGPGDGSATFTLPNLMGKVPVGFDAAQLEFNNLGNTGGEKTHTLTAKEVPRTGIEFSRYFGDTSPAPSLGGDGLNNLTRFYTDGGGQPHNNLQPYGVVNYIIKF